MSGNKKIQDKPKTEEKIQEFLNKYNTLCKEYKLRIVVSPAWRASQDTGDWRLVLQTSVGKLPRQRK